MVRSILSPSQACLAASSLSCVVALLVLWGGQSVCGQVLESASAWRDDEDWFDRQERAAALSDTAVVNEFVVVRRGGNRFVLEVAKDDQGVPLVGLRAVARRRIDSNQTDFPVEVFDEWVFGDREPAARDKKREELSELASGRVARLVQGRHLNASQRELLQLAADGDVARLFSDIERTRAVFQEVRGNREAMVPVFERIRQHQQCLKNGPFDDKSLFAKVRRLVTQQSNQVEVPQ